MIDFIILIMFIRVVLISNKDVLLIGVDLRE